MTKPSNPIDAVIATPANLTLDDVMRRDPKMVTDAELETIVIGLRHDRDLFIKADERKAAARQGVELEDDADTPAPDA